MTRLYFPSGKDAGEDSEILGAYTVGDWSGRTDSSIKTYRASHDRRRRRGIARHHYGADAQRVQLRNERRRIRSRRIAESDDSRELQRLRRTHRDGQHPEALRLELVRRRGRIGRWWREAHDRGKGSLHDTHRGAARIDSRGLGHLRGGIERHKLTQFRQIGGAGLRGGGANGRVYGILPAIRTGEGGHSQNVRFVKAGHGVYGGHLQFVARQRARLVRAQHVDAGRFIHGGEPRWKDAQMRQSPRAERRRKGKGGRQRYRDRRQNRREHQGNDLTRRQLESVGIPHQHHDDDAVEHGEIAHHAQNGLLLGTFDVRGANQLRGASKLRARSGRRNLRNGFAAPHQRPCIGLQAWPSFDGYGFAGEHGLVEQDLAFDQTHVGGNHGAER